MKQLPSKVILFLALLLCSMIFVSCKDKIIEIEVGIVPNIEGELKFNSIEEAIAKATSIRESGNNSQINIVINEGDYYLAKPITINSGLNDISILAAKDKKVTIKGSKPIDLTWSKYDDNILVAQTSETEIEQFFVNGSSQTLARYPNYNKEGGIWNGYASDAISKDRISNWSSTDGAILHALHRGKWGGMHYKVVGVDDDGKAILEGGFQNNRYSEPHAQYRMVENVFEELDSPGEWYFDIKTNKLYYWPEEGLDIEHAKFESTELKSLIEIKGSEANPVSNLTIRGINFEQTKRTIFEKYEPLLRSDWMIYRGAALLFEGTENCLVENCTFTDLGGNAIFVSDYNRDVIVRGNHIYNCGASAICFVGDPSAVRSPAFNYKQVVPLATMDTVKGPKNDLFPKDCKAEDNLIHNIGLIEKQTAGVQISMSMDITVSHNSIYDVPRAGINIGDGTWGGHIIEFNDVFNTVLETGDHGAFNSWGRDRFWSPNRSEMDSITSNNPEMVLWDAIHTTVIRNNRFRCDHGWDIDLDDGSTNYNIYNNLCLNGGIKLREGFYRHVENNITVNNSFHPHVWFKNCDDVVKKNIFFDSYKDIRVNSWGKEVDYNFFLKKADLIKAQAHNIDKHSKFGEAEFIDPQSLDYSVSDNSPALETGFRNFDMDIFGVVSPKLKGMAKTPEIPIYKTATDSGTKQAVLWLKNEIKSVGSKEEQSAYGLNTPEGVIVVNLQIDSFVSNGNGLKQGDVIVKVQGHDIHDVDDFFSALKRYNYNDHIGMVVVRNQSKVNLNVQIKPI